MYKLILQGLKFIFLLLCFVWLVTTFFGFWPAVGAAGLCWILIEPQFKKFASRIEFDNSHKKWLVERIEYLINLEMPDQSEFYELKKLEKEYAEVQECAKSEIKIW